MHPHLLRRLRRIYAALERENRHLRALLRQGHSLQEAAKRLERRRPTAPGSRLARGSGARSHDSTRSPRSGEK
jgi:hypothetical protein